MRLFLIFSAFFSCVAIKAQGFRVQHYPPGSLNSNTEAIFEASPGNYFAAGIVSDTINNVGYGRLCLMGLGNTGQIQWVKKYGTPKFQYLNDIFISKFYYKQGNNLYLAACVLDSNNNYLGAFIKFDLNGDMVWQKTFSDTSNYVYPQMVTGSVDGGFLLTGFFVDFVNGGERAMLIKTDANGNELWRRKINKTSPNVQDGKAIVQDSASKKIVIVGYQYIGGANIYENILILDSLGANPLQRHYSTYGGILVDLIQTRDKKFVAVGESIYPQTSQNFYFTQSYIVKFDINAPNIPLWKIDNFDKLEYNNTFTTIKELPNGDLLVGGLIDTMQIHNFNTNCLTRITKFNANGILKSNVYHNYKTNDINKENNQTLKSINLTSDGGYVGAIECVNFPGPNPFFFVKYDSTGCDSSMIYCQMIAAGLAKNYLNRSYLQIYPNPTDGILHLDFSGSGYPGGSTCIISDLSGREILTKNLTPGQQKQKLDLKELSAGVYMLSVIQNAEVIYRTKLVRQE